MRCGGAPTSAVHNAVTRLVEQHAHSPPCAVFYVIRPFPFWTAANVAVKTEYAKNRGLAPGPTPASPSPVCDPCAASASQTATLELALFTDTNLIALVKYFPASIRYSGACPNPGQMQR